MPFRFVEGLPELGKVREIILEGRLIKLSLQVLPRNPEATLALRVLDDVVLLVRVRALEILVVPVHGARILLISEAGVALPRILVCVRVVFVALLRLATACKHKPVGVEPLQHLGDAGDLFLSCQPHGHLLAVPRAEVCLPQEDLPLGMSGSGEPTSALYLRSTAALR